MYAQIPIFRFSEFLFNCFLSISVFVLLFIYANLFARLLIVFFDSLASGVLRILNYLGSLLSVQELWNDFLIVTIFYSVFLILLKTFLFLICYVLNMLSICRQISIYVTSSHIYLWGNCSNQLYGRLDISSVSFVSNDILIISFSRHLDTWYMIHWHMPLWHMIH